MIKELKFDKDLLYEYGFYKNIKCIGQDDRHVILEDRFGNTKRVYKSLFKKHAKLMKKEVED